MIVLCAKTNQRFGVQRDRPTLTSTPKGIYAILCLFLLLWISALIALCADWPTDSKGHYLKRMKRKFDFGGGIQDAALNGITWGCFSMDLVFMYVSNPIF